MQDSWFRIRENFMKGLNHAITIASSDEGDSHISE
jgi:hypothetical protein